MARHLRPLLPREKIDHPVNSRLSLLPAPLCMLSVIGAASAEGLRVLAAGSLREVMAEIAEHYKEVPARP